MTPAVADRYVPAVFDRLLETRDPVCVLGMHRSGTSLTARILNLLGVDLGPEEGLVEPGRVDNPSGYWEQEAVVGINDAVLEALGGAAVDPPAGLAPGWEHAPELDSLRQRARAEVERSFGEAPLWGFKDPRMSITLPFWREIVGKMRYVVCVRNPAEVAASLSRRRQPPTQEGWLALWLRYTAAALEHTAGLPRLLIFYDDLFEDHRSQVHRLAEFLDLDVRPEIEPVIADFFEKRLRHHTRHVIELLADEDAPAEAQALYVGLRALGADADGEVADALAARLLQSYEERTSRVRELEERLRSTEDTLGRQLGRQHELADGLAARLLASHERSRELEERLRSTAEELDRHKGWLDSVQTSASWRLTAPLRAVKRRLARWTR